MQPEQALDLLEALLDILLLIAASADRSVQQLDRSGAVALVLGQEVRNGLQSWSGTLSGCSARTRRIASNTRSSVPWNAPAT
jgi:hypothetical protein